MAVLPLRFEGDPVLRDVAQPVLAFDDRLADFVADMFATMYAAKGRGLAAPQVGVLIRVFVVDVTWKEGERTPIVFVNPVIVVASDVVNRGSEACLSIPDRTFEVPRPEWVDLEWFDTLGVRHERRFTGIDAVCVCHELDHLDGVLITNSGVEI